ncbi:MULTISPECIES: WGR domain-containing protein [unclassified Variovorax]|nr:MULTISPECIES: WGR domain-containing protein [unclassified Variovorax]VTU42256.1 ATP-dependent DNA ligase [Variovorax sp. PBL-H6]VTU44126.1 ATP-dependent DNA ligase [Variovorax sp. SRS16]VTU44208.1 ATP-dependent DNA ligase [Variovorax sp. PBL-E5]
MQAEKISLFYKDAKSNKEYHAQLEQKEPGWVVLFQYGPRGGTLTSGAKTKAPVGYEAAKKTYDKLVSEKVGKGYSPGEAGSAFVNTSMEERFTGVVPQLLNVIDEEQAQRLLDDPDWLMQPKYDGHRRLTQHTGTELLGINRKGLATGLPECVAKALAALEGHAPYVLDGELIGETYFVFDILEWEGMDMKVQECGYRVSMLQAVQDLLKAAGAKQVAITGTAYTSEAKRALYAAVKSASGEGLVFKHRDAQYVPGRPNSGGNQLKRVFTHRATVIVGAQSTTKRSVSMVLLDEAGAEVDVGNVTIPPNHLIPAVRALAEVEYLYAFKGGSLFQPRYQGARDDVGTDACSLKQLVFKPEGVSSDEADEA